MADVREILDFSDPALDVYARLTEAQLMNRFDPSKALFIAESPKVIHRALDGGYKPVSMLMERKDIDGSAAEIIARCPDIPVYTADEDLLCNRQCTDFYMLLMPGNKPFKTKDLSKQIGSSRLSFASGEYMEQFLDITPGSLSVLGLMNDKENRVRLLIDEEVLSGEFIGCHPCINTSSLKLKTADVVNVLLPAMDHSYQTVSLPNYTEETDG